MEGRERTHWLAPADWPIFVKILVSVVGVVALALGATTYSNVHTLESDLRERIGLELETLAVAQVSHLADILSENLTILRSIALTDQVKASAEIANTDYSGGQDAIEAQLLAVDEQWRAASDDSQLVQSIVNPQLNRLALQLLGYKETYPNHVEIFVTDRYGALLASTGRTSDYYQADEDWWQAAYNNGQGAFYISQPEYDESAGYIALDMAVPILSERGEVLGIARTTLRMDAIYELVSRVRIGETGQVAVIDLNGLIVADSRPEYVGEQLPPSWAMPEMLQMASHWHEMVDEEGVSMLAGHASISGVEIEHKDEADVVYLLGWVLYVWQEQEEAYAPVATATRTGFVAVAVFALIAAGLAFVIARAVVAPIADLVGAARQMAAGDLSARAQSRRRDETGELADAFNRMADEVAGMVDTLEQRVAERTRALAYRSVQLETAAQISQAAGSILDPGELERLVVELIRRRFGYYYVGLFLVDQSGEWTGEPGRWAVLRAGTGEAGQAMLEAGHKLEAGGESMIGVCVAEGQARIALDVGEEAVRFDNPLLPETRSEMALPLMARGQVIGALSVQSVQESAFSDEDVSILQTMAAQVANAIQNARLFAQTQTALAQTDALYAGSERVARATNLEEVLQVLVESTSLQRLDRVSIAFFNHPWEDEMPEEAIIMAAWERSGQEPDAPVGTRYPLGQFPAIAAVNRDEPAVFYDIATDERVDETLRAFLLDRLGMRSLLLWPLVAGGQWIGIFNGQAATAIEMDKDEVRQIDSLIDQAATVIQSLRLLDETRDRATQLETAAEVSRAASSILDVDELLTTSANLIRDRFDFYYAGLFLVDETGQFAVLRAGTGEAGQVMLAQGHRLRVGGESMIGWCVANQQARIALDVGQDAIHFDNPLLPDTRSEMALLLISRGEAIGALSVQSTEQAAFSDEDVAILQTMADQMANAIANARLVEQTQQALAEAESARQETQVALAEAEAVHRRYLQQEWRSFLAGPVGAQLRGFQDGPEGTVPVSDSLTLEHEVDDRGRRQLVVPIKLRDETIGLIDLSRDDDLDWSESDQALAVSFAENLALAIENARLFEQTQYRAHRERLTREITDRIRGQTGLDAILRTTIRELGKVLGTSHAAIRLGTETELSSPPSG